MPASSARAIRWWSTTPTATASRASRKRPPLPDNVRTGLGAGPDPGPAPVHVDNPVALRGLAAGLQTRPGIGVDTEADSFYSYREKTCLLQISTADADYLVDPLAVPDLSALKPVFANPAVCKVFHAAENDVSALRRDFGMQTAGLFDTMAAGRILGFPRVGLGDLLREFFQVETNKRLQRYAWGRRPLDPAAIKYAAVDSRYLLPLREILGAKLHEAGRLEEAEEEFLRLERSTARDRVFDPEALWRVKGAYTLTPVERAVLRELFIWRDGQAAARDRPPFRVLPDAALIALATQQPRDLKTLQGLGGIPESAVRYSAAPLLDAVRRGLRAPPQPLRHTPRPDEEFLQRYERLRTWRRGLAGERGVEPDVIVSNATLQAVAEHRPASLDELEALALLGPWKLRTYGAALLQALAGYGGRAIDSGNRLGSIAETDRLG